MDSLIIQDIYIYPIKSLGGIRLNEATVEEKGFRYDRRWMLIDEEGVFVSQRSFPKLALLQVELSQDALKVFPKHDPGNFLLIPFDQEGEESVEVVVWDDTMTAKLVDAKFDRWFSDFLGKHVRLVKMPESTRRLVSPKYAVRGEAVSFADGMPYLLIGEESLNDLNQKLEKPVSMDRFRPNLVFSGGKPFQEDTFKKIKIGSVDFQVVKPCARCVLITVDQETGIKSKEPLRTLSSYRTKGNKVLFGQNMVALGEGVVKIGDPINISE
ncbi:MOSC domain-containing protein [Algoriphagus kandeliae]|uniref:MOSC domain-containing protein n=1 Tax=Algoriphagus kandeliae TaxID=2562278 RepID=A0A4Y9QR46_9BACT|nr:MOSC N-terminal beta barrel domain-containing protein [Algoriphagus kandeliae]TFV94737.1 MOSC domain-containing protein [Algoriphagus kandeliae]